MSSTQQDRTTVVVICMVDSIHSARWLENFKHKNIDFTLIPSTPNRRVHPIIKELLKVDQNMNATYSLNSYLRWLSIPLWGLDLILNNKIRGILVSRIAQKLDANFVHAMELNHAGYIAHKAHKAKLPPSCLLVASNWGSDIYWFQQFKRHKKRLTQLLVVTDIYSAECNRDLELASNLGFGGKFKEVIPTGGGFELTSAYSLKPSERKIILIKGYESFVGRASLALKSLLKIEKELLENYEIVVYSANKKTVRLASTIGKLIDKEITCHAKKSLSHGEMMKLFAQARVYVGVSLSDGISTSLLEAIVMGTFPIQTNTSCANEWITQGVNGITVEPEIEAICSSLRQSLIKDELVDTAAKLNRKIFEERLVKSKLQKKLENFYA